MSSGKPLEDISQAHIVSLLYILMTSAKDADDLSIGFDRDRIRRQLASSNNKSLKGKYHVRIMLGDVFGFAEHQKKAAYDLGYKSRSTKNSYYSVLNKVNATSLMVLNGICYSTHLVWNQRR